MPLGETLVQNGVITREQLETALEEQKKDPQRKIGEILIRLGYLPIEELESSPWGNRTSFQAEISPWGSMTNLAAAPLSKSLYPRGASSSGITVTFTALAIWILS